jgi:CHASE3 domain sensor protein
MNLRIAKSFRVLAPGNSLRKRTAYSLALVRLILVPVIVLAVYYLFRMGSIVDRIVNVDAPASSFAQQASIQMLEARRAERNYLLLHDPSYVEANRAALQGAQQALDHIRELEPDEGNAIDKAVAALQFYRQRASSFEGALQQPEQNPTERIRAVIRAYEQDLDNLLKTAGRRNRAKLLEELRKRVDSFDSQISETVQSSNPELRRVSDDLQNSSQQILEITSELESGNWSRVQRDHAEARRLLEQAEIALSVVSAITLILSIWMSYILPGQVVKPLVSLKEAVDQAAQGNYEIEFDVEGKGETVELAKSLQQMFAVMRQNFKAVPPVS